MPRSPTCQPRAPAPWSDPLPEAAQVAPGVFRITVPIPFVLGSVNLYLVETAGGFLLIDTGIATGEAFRATREGLDHLGIGFDRISTIVVTHFHADHAGQAARLQALCHAPVLMSAADAGYLADFTANGPPLGAEQFFHSHGAPGPVVQAFRSVLPELGRLVAPFTVSRTVGTGDRIGAGRELVGLLTPGHTPGHLCLALPGEGLLFAGDHVLAGITPHIGVYSVTDTNPLRNYLDSLDAVLAAGPRRIFPAHGPIIEDPPVRVAELLAHHRRRLDHVASAAGNGGSTAWDVARHVFGEDLDLLQSWLAFFESLAHLEYLVADGALCRAAEGGRVVYVEG